ncbi:MAG: homoserine dehydrogenase [Bacteroidetes bacterium B1(2017)]|nr:MAG: homoserine dehydrogenase [Bacteroidetes bacterium B1(2017)]
MTKKLTIGLFGYGCVGSGLFKVLNQVPNLTIQIKTICVKNKGKTRDIAPSHFTFDKNQIINDPEINLVVELIDNAEEAFEIVHAALSNGKAVVTANKKMLAQHFQTLTNLSKEKNAALLYEAAVAGAIPIIRTLEEYYKNDSITRIEGILNGTSNLIVSKTQNPKYTYASALEEAQKQGFAESNPKLDVEGFDSKFKLCLLLAHAYGLIVNPEEIVTLGIQNLLPCDSNFAREKNQCIKLIAHASIKEGKITAFVVPRLVPPSSLFSEVKNEFNGIQVDSDFTDTQFFIGKGAGHLPTAAAVLSDISALQNTYVYPLTKLQKASKLSLHTHAVLRVYLRYVNPETLGQIRFQTIEQKYQRSTHTYVIGKIALKELLALQLRAHPDVFVAEISATNLVQKSLQEDSTHERWDQHSDVFLESIPLLA